MHRARLTEDFLEAARAQRGGDRPMPPASRTALLVVDMQNVFLAPKAPLEVPGGRAIADNVNRLAVALRQAGGKVIWVYTTLPEAGSDRDWIYLSDFLHPARRETIRKALRPEHDLHALWHSLDVRRGDLSCSKDRFSPFSPGASTLDGRLRQAGITHLVIAGATTNLSCECTAREAMMLNYRVTVVEDATAAQTDEDHLCGLATLAQFFATIAMTDALVAAFTADA